MTKLAVESIGDGPPLALLHGWAMHSGIWGPTLEHLAQTHRVHAIDLPGHGRSAPVSPCTLDAMVTAVDRTFSDEAQPLAVLGWSFGGLVAMRWARAKPARISRLALVCTSPRFVTTDDWAHAMSAPTIARFADELHVAWELTLQRFLALQVHNSEHGRATLAAMREQLSERGAPSPRVLDETLAILRDTDLRAEVAEIAQPTLVISGARDSLAWPAAGRWLAWTIPGAQLYQIEGAAHAPFLSHGDEFLVALESFLGGR